MEKTGEKKGVNLIVRVLLVSIIPLLLTVVFGQLSIRSVGKAVSEKLVLHELNSTVYALEMTLDALASGDFSCENGTELYKGDYNITEKQEILDQFQKQTDVDVTLFWGDTRVATSILDADGNRMVGTKIDEMVYKQVQEKGTYFTSDIKIGDKDYFGYYTALKNTDGSAIGVIFTGMEASSVTSIYNARVRNNILFMMVITVLSILMIVMVMRKIVKALVQIVHNLDHISDGNLTTTVNDKVLERSDEVGKIARSAHSLVQGLIQIVQNIHTSSNSLNDFTGKFRNNFDSINNSISNVNNAVEEIANGATNQAGETQKVSSQITDMGNAIARTTSNVESLMASTNEMQQNNEKLNVTLDELIEISNHTKESVDQVYEQTNNTNQSVMDIGSAVDMITDIANQTNMLSLNASIEAARAGEHGRGFAVVAEEIRQLADESRRSAEKISGIVEQLIHNSNVSVQTMNEVLKEIENQNERLGMTKDVFGELNREIHNVAGAIDEISKEIDTINDSKNEVLESSESLAAIAEENAASTQETSASMIELGKIVSECNEATQELVQISDTLSENAGKFTLG